MENMVQGVGLSGKYGTRRRYITLQLEICLQYRINVATYITKLLVYRLNLLMQNTDFPPLCSGFHRLGDISGALTELRHLPKNGSTLKAYRRTNHFSLGLTFIAGVKHFDCGICFHDHSYRTA